MNHYLTFHKPVILFLFLVGMLIACNKGMDTDTDGELVVDCRIELNFTAETMVIPPIWNGISCAFLPWFLHKTRPDVNEVHLAGFEWVRFQEIFHTVYKENDGEGKPVYNWITFDAVLDKAVDAGYKLMLVTESTPDILASQESKPNYTYCNRYPPADYGKWYSFIQDVVRHCQLRYGEATVESWYWEVWNEPNAPLYFWGTQENYLKIYDYTVSAIKDVNPDLKVGGVAETLKGEGSWIAALVEHCLQEENTFTGEIGTPIDFLSFHTYPGMAEPPDLQKMELMMERVNAIKRDNDMDDVPVIISEWNSTAGLTDMRDYSYNAAFAVKACRIMLDHQISQSFFHTLGDYPYSESNSFSRGAGFYTTSKVPKAVYHCMTLLNRHYENRMVLNSDSDQVDGFSTKLGNKVNIVLTNYEESPDPVYTTLVGLELKGIPDQYDQVLVKSYIIDRDHADSYKQWLSWGGPAELSAGQIIELKALSKLEVAKEEVIPLENHSWLEKFSMRSHSVVFFEAEFLSSH